MRLDALGPFGIAVIAAYLVGLALISALTRRHATRANDFLNASGKLPMLVVTLALLAYNCGSIEIIGMSAMASQYGIQALHFYWIGGIPGLVFFALAALPYYVRSGAHSLPEYLDKRFGPGVRFLNACIVMICTAAQAGVALYAVARVLHAIVDISLPVGGLAAALVVLGYVLVGGIRTTIFTSIFQLFILVAGLAPLAALTLPFRATDFVQRPANWHLWHVLPLFSPQAPLDQLSVVLGLGFVISFSYWCTDFGVVQRALTARGAGAVQKAPLLAGFGKMAIAFLVVLPGAAAPTLFAGLHSVPHDETLPALLRAVYGKTWLGLGLAALVSSLMAGLAANIAAFAAAWIEEIYRVQLRPHRSEKHYIQMGRLSICACLLLAALVAGLTSRFRDLMEFLQLVLSLFFAPMLAVVLAGMFARRTGERDAERGLTLGVASALLLEAAVALGVLRFGSQMSANFYIAIAGFLVAMVGIFLRFPRRQQTDLRCLPQGACNGLRSMTLTPASSTMLLALLLLLVCLALNILWW